MKNHRHNAADRGKPSWEWDVKMVKTVATFLLPVLLIYAMLPGITASFSDGMKSFLQGPLMATQTGTPSATPSMSLSSPWSFDEINRFSQEITGNPLNSFSSIPGTSIPRAGASPLTGPIQNLNYNYDLVGNITQINDTSITPTAKTSTYSYDDRNFLTSVSTSGFSVGDYTQTYAYDSLGNLAYKSDIGTINHNGTGFPGPHAITSIGSDNYTYDINGNLLSDGENTYTWTILNELDSVTNVNGTTVYTYDAFSRKVKSVFTPVVTPENPTPSPQTTIYVNNLMEVREDGPVYYVNAGGERVASYTLYEGGTWRYYHNDHLSGTTLTTDEDGEVVQVLDYEPYGEQTLSTDYNTQGSPYSFTGKELDPSSGLYYYEARWYDPETGHFISTDPFPRRNPATMIPDPARWNEYAYARGNPVAYNDPSGESAMPLLAILYYGGVSATRMAINFALDNYLARTGNFYTAQFMKHSLQAKPSNLTFGSNSNLANTIRGTDLYQGLVSNIQKKIGEGILNGGGGPEDFLPYQSGDLKTSLGDLAYSWDATENADGTYDINIHFNDPYNFEIEDDYGDPVLDTVNNAAEVLSETGVMNEYDVNIEMEESIQVTP